LAVANPDDLEAFLGKQIGHVATEESIRAGD
jgi:hypothetical protein